MPRSEHPRPADARSPSEVRFAPYRFRTPPAKASLGPLPENFLGHLGSGSRRHTLRASMYNRTLLIGRIGHDAEAKTDKNQQEYVVLSIATKDVSRTPSRAICEPLYFSCSSQLMTVLSSRIL